MIIFMIPMTIVQIFLFMYMLKVKDYVMDHILADEGRTKEFLKDHEDINVSQGANTDEEKVMKLFETFNKASSVNSTFKLSSIKGNPHFTFVSLETLTQQYSAP